MRVGITGHQRLPSEADWVWVEEAMRLRLKGVANLIGVSSLATGADQLFSRIVLQLGGQLVAIIPFPEYRRTFGNAPSLAEYSRLLEAAHETVVLSGKQSDEDSYLEAGQTVVRMSDILFTVWNGKPAKGKGGTADIVDFAIGEGRPVVHFTTQREVVDLRK